VPGCTVWLPVCDAGAAESPGKCRVQFVCASCAADSSRFEQVAKRQRTIQTAGSVRLSSARNIEWTATRAVAATGFGTLSLLLVVLLCRTNGRGAVSQQQPQQPQTVMELPGWDAIPGSYLCQDACNEVRCGAQGMCNERSSCAAPEEMHAVRCCEGFVSYPGTSGERRYTPTEHMCTGGKLNLAQARQFCASGGARLCTAAELEFDCPTDPDIRPESDRLCKTVWTGCGLDNELVWSSTPGPPAR
jgi:hypothetical protein